MITNKFVSKVITWAMHIAETENAFHDDKLHVFNRDGQVWYFSQHMGAAIPVTGFTLCHSKTAVIHGDRFLDLDTHESLKDTRQTIEITLKKKAIKLRIFTDLDGREYRVREDMLKLFSALDGYYLTGSTDLSKVFVHDSANDSKPAVGIICCVERK